MQRAVEQATLVLPVLMQDVELGGMVQIHDLWKQILNQKSWKDRIPMVILTHTRIEEHALWELEGFQISLARDTWDDGNRAHDVLCCDSLYGLAAVQLEKALRNAKSSQDLENLAARVEDTCDPIRPVGIWLLIWFILLVTL